MILFDLVFVTGVIQLVCADLHDQYVSSYSKFRKSRCRNSGRSSRSRNEGCLCPHGLFSDSSDSSSSLSSESKQHYYVTELLHMLEEAKMLQPKSPLSTENHLKSEANTTKEKEFFKIGPELSFKSFLRMPYLRDAELQQEFYDLIKGSVESKERKQRRLQNLFLEPHYREAEIFLKSLDNKICRLIISIEAARPRGVPYEAVIKTEKVIALKKKTIAYMEDEMRKALENINDKNQQDILDKCNIDGPYFVSPAEEVFLGLEVYVPKKKLILIINMVSSQITVFLGFLYVNPQGRTRLVRLMRPLILSSWQLKLMKKEISITDVSGGNPLSKRDVFKIKANILSAVVAHKSHNIVYGMPLNFEHSKGLQHLASCHTEEEIVGALQYISVYEPHLMYLNLGSESESLSRKPGDALAATQFLNMFFPERRPAVSVLEAYLSSGIAPIIDLLPSRNIFPQASVISVEGLSERNFMILSVTSASVPNMKILAAFIFTSSSHVQAMKNILEENNQSHVPLVSLLERKAMALSERSRFPEFHEH